MRGVRSLVLLHGFTGAPEAWDAVIRHLPEGIGVLRPWVGGHGPAPRTACVFEQEVDRLAAVVESAVGEGAHLCGYSLGGRLALGMMARHPRLFGAATMIGAHPGLESAKERAVRVAQDDRWATALEREGIDAFIDAWAALPLFATQADLPDGLRAAQDRWRRAHDPRGLAWALRTLGLGRMPAWHSHLRAIAQPAQVVVGERDAKFRPVAAGLADGLLRGRLCVIRASGHNVVLEQPAALAALLLEEWPS